MARRIIQFGTSRFLQAHVDLFVDEARSAGQDIGPIAVVQTSASSANAERVSAFGSPDGYPVIMRGIKSGKIIDQQQMICSVDQGLIAERDWQKLTSIFVDEAEFVISNVGDAGYAVPVSDDHTSLASKTIPECFVGKLTALLLARWQINANPVTFLPCELISRNGQTLKAAILLYAEASQAAASFLEWLDGKITFANTLVDRIVSQALDPIGAIAEPYALWAIERQHGLEFPFTHPAIRIVDSLEPYERLKLHILNLGHTFLADLWIEQRRPEHETVREILAHNDVSNALDHVLRNEVIPGFVAHGMGDEAGAYVTTTLERFSNPFLEHRLADIAQNHNIKIERRIVAFLEWCKTGANATFSTPILNSIVAATRAPQI